MIRQVHIMHSKDGFKLHVFDVPRWRLLVEKCCWIMHPFGLWSRFVWAYRIHDWFAAVEWRGEKEVLTIPISDEDAEKFDQDFYDTMKRVEALP